MEHFWHFLKILKLWHFSENPQITRKISSKFMSANANSVRFKFACNVHDWAYFEILSVSGKTEDLNKFAYGLVQDISCIKFLAVSDLKVIFKRCKRSRHSE